MRLRHALLTAAMLALPASLTLGQPPARPAPVSSPAPPLQSYATINGVDVTPAYYETFSQNHFSREIMDDLIRARAIEDEARAQSISVSNDDVNAELGRMRKAFSSDTDFTARIQDQGLTMKGYREQVRTQLLLAKLMERVGAIPDADARAYYDRNMPQFSTEAQLHILCIVTDTPGDAMVAARAVGDGTPFEVAAGRFNPDDAPGKDGDLGLVTARTVPVPGLWEYAQALPVTSTSEPVEIGDRYYIVRVAEARPATKQEFEAVKEHIKDTLRAERGINETDYVTSLLAKASIRVLWEPIAYLDQEYRMLKGIRLAVNGRTLRLNPPPFMTPEGSMMVPAKQLLEAVGATATWRNSAKVLEAKRDAMTVAITVGEKTLVANGEFLDTKSPAMIRDGITFCPPREVLTALGLRVNWNQTTKLLSVVTAGSE